MTTKSEALAGVLRERYPAYRPGFRDEAVEQADHILASPLWPLVERAIVRESEVTAMLRFHNLTPTGLTRDCLPNCDACRALAALDDR